MIQNLIQNISIIPEKLTLKKTANDLTAIKEDLIIIPLRKQYFLALIAKKDNRLSIQLPKNLWQLPHEERYEGFAAIGNNCDPADHSPDLEVLKALANHISFLPETYFVGGFELLAKHNNPEINKILQKQLVTKVFVKCRDNCRKILSGQAQ